MKKVIGFRLKNLRKTKGLKREGLAKIIVVSCICDQGLGTRNS